MSLPSLIDALYETEGKAEIINGEIVRSSPDGALPGRASDEILVSLRHYVRRKPLPGMVASGTVAFVVDLPHRKSFCASVAYYEGPRSEMKFFEGAPRFAVEVHNEWDRGLDAERAIAAKRRDYFAAGTRVVWDVDLQSTEIVRKYTTDAPDNPTVFRRGEVADAEPAVPGWRMPADDLFEPSKDEL